MSRTAPLYERHYFSRPGFRDGQSRFFDIVRQTVPPGSEILELGAGPANTRTPVLSAIGRVTGLDISEEVFDNPDLAEARTFDGVTFPFPDQTFDACVSVFVVEHVEHADAHFREVARVLRPGGTYTFWTPNLHHYVALASNLLPHSVHLAMANRLRGLSGEHHDPYPTFYRANTRSAIEREAAKAGLRPVRFDFVESEPSYGRAHPALFYPMMAYERLVNGIPALERFRGSLQVVMQTASS